MLGKKVHVVDHVYLSDVGRAMHGGGWNPSSTWKKGNSRHGALIRFLATYDFLSHRGAPRQKTSRLALNLFYGTYTTLRETTCRELRK